MFVRNFANISDDVEKSSLTRLNLKKNICNFSDILHFS